MNRDETAAEAPVVAGTEGNVGAALPVFAATRRVAVDVEAFRSGKYSSSVCPTAVPIMTWVPARTRWPANMTHRAATLLARRKKRPASSEPGPEVLSPRELTAIRLYASGFSAKETGKEMYLAPKTVEGYLARAKAKLGLHTRRDLARFALETGLIRAEGEP